MLIFSVAQFSFVERQHVVTEGINSTVSMCTVLSDGSLEKTVTLTLESEGNKTQLIYNVSDVLSMLGGTLASDYRVKAPIIFQPGSSSAEKTTYCFVVDIMNDDIVEDTEKYNLRLNVTSSGCTVSSDPSMAVVELTIFDDYTDGRIIIY